MVNSFTFSIRVRSMGPFKCYVMQMGGGVTFSGNKRYEGVMYNIISVTTGWGPISWEKALRSCNT